MRKQRQWQWLALLTCLLTCFAQQAYSQPDDDLQTFVDQLSAAQTLRGGALRADAVNVPVGLPQIDLSQFASSQNRVQPLRVRTGIEFINGTLSASSSFNGEALMVISSEAQVLLNASATIDARQIPTTSDCYAAVSISGSSSFYQYGYVYAPRMGTAVYIGDANSCYYYMPGRTEGSINNAGHGTVKELDGDDPLPVVSNYEWTIGPGGNFPDINTAMEDRRVEEGDTIEVLAGTEVSEEQYLMKKVVLIGPGYAKENGKRPCHFKSISIEADEATLHGIAAERLWVRADDVVIERCYTSQGISSDEDYFGDNAIIRGCYVGGFIDNASTEGWTLNNNIIALSDIVVSGSQTGFPSRIITCPARYANINNATIDHNLFRFNDFSRDNEFSESVLTNNILFNEAESDISIEGCELSRNVFANVAGAEANNQFGNWTATDLFVCLGEETDEDYWMLTGTSPAKGYATDESDCGPWTGSYPYWVDGTEAVTPLEPMNGGDNYVLDLHGEDNAAAYHYNSLQALLTDISTRGLGGSMFVNVAPGTYHFVIDERSVRVLNRLAAVLEATGYSIYMYCYPSDAIFSFDIDEAFIAQHEHEIAALTEQMEAMLAKIELENIQVYINGNPLIFDSFEVEPNDLLALKNMYQRWDGPNWTSKKWSFENNGRNRDDFPGVAFDDDGRVTGIDLANNGLKGKLFSIDAPQLDHMSSLNLSHNQLTGDIALLTTSMTSIVSLNLSYNLLSEMSEPSAIASTCRTRNLTYQFRQWKQGQTADTPYADAIWDVSPVIVPVCKQAMTLSLPSLFNYQYVGTKYLRNVNDPTQTYGSLVLNSNTGMYTLNRYSDYRIWKLPQDFLAAVDIPGGHDASYSAYLVKLHYAPGDADLSAYTNVYDVQWTLNYILAPQTVTDFNFSAADTYTDQQINVQDIVATVNIVLDQPMEEFIEIINARGQNGAAVNYDGTVEARQGSIVLNTKKEVAAIDVEIEGVSTNEVGLMLNQRDFQMVGRNTERGSRYVIFSPTGKRIAANKSVTLLRMSAAGVPVNIQCSDANAQEVMIGVEGVTTGIASAPDTDETAGTTVYDLQGRRLEPSKAGRGIYIKNGKKVVVK